MIDVINFPLTTCGLEFALTIALVLQTNRLTEWANIFESYMKIIVEDKLEPENL